MTVVIRPVGAADVAAICDIYNHYIHDTVITFEEEPVSEKEMAGRIALVTERHPWLIAEYHGELAGYAYATSWKTRSAYRFAVETTIYLSHRQTGQSIGTKLYRALIDELRPLGVHCALGGIALPNPASIALHEKLGFTKIAQFREVGWKFGRWVDVGYWELLMEGQ